MNDTSSVALTVAATAAAQVTAGKAVSSPAPPRAGRSYTLALPLTKAGEPVTPTAARCTATLAGRSLKGAAARQPGQARCTWKVPVGSKGKTLGAKLVATAGGKAFTATRIARVA